MPDCPECGSAVPPKGRFCPDCGTDLASYMDNPDEFPSKRNQRTQPASDSPPQDDLGRQTHRNHADQHSQGTEPSSDQYGHPGGPAGAGYEEQPAQPRPTDHKLLIGSVLTLGVIGLIEGAVQALYPEMFLELIEQEQFGLEGELTAEIFLITGILGVIVSLLVIGATAYFYREGYFRKAYFWLLLGSGVAGFFLVGSLFLTILVAFGIYGLISVMK